MLLPLAVVLVIGSVTSQETTRAPRVWPSLETLLSKKPHYSLFLDLLRSAGLVDRIEALPHATIFAPTNAALSTLTAAEYNALKGDSRRLLELLQYHVTDQGAWHTNGRDNDKVLSSLDHNLPIRINIYRQMHSIAAEGINITEQNMKINNGWIHGIDGLMQPPKGDILQIINSNPELSTLGSLIAKSGLDAAIRADQNITIFAPTNDAFANLNPAVLIYLQNTPGALEEVLQYHIVPKTSLYSIGMRHQELFGTAAGSRNHPEMMMLIEDVDNGKIMVNNAEVTHHDVSATNGVLHEIDDVLIPTPILVKMEDMGLGHHAG